MSVSLNVMDAAPEIRWRDQYIIDLDNRTIERNVSVTASECLLSLAVHFDDNGLDIAEEFARNHPSDRMRLSAVDALASAVGYAGERHRLFERYARSDSCLVSAVSCQRADAMTDAEPDAIKV